MSGYDFSRIVRCHTKKVFGFSRGQESNLPSRTMSLIDFLHGQEKSSTQEEDRR